MVCWVSSPRISKDDVYDIGILDLDSNMKCVDANMRIVLCPEVAGYK